MLPRITNQNWKSVKDMLLVCLAQLVLFVRKHDSILALLLEVYFERRSLERVPDDSVRGLMSRSAHSSARLQRSLPGEEGTESSPRRKQCSGNTRPPDAFCTMTEKLREGGRSAEGRSAPAHPLPDGEQELRVRAAQVLICTRSVPRGSLAG